MWYAIAIKHKETRMYVIKCKLCYYLLYLQTAIYILYIKPYAKLHILISIPIAPFIIIL